MGTGEHTSDPNQYLEQALGQGGCLQEIAHLAFDSTEVLSPGEVADFIDLPVSWGMDYRLVTAHHARITVAAERYSDEIYTLADRIGMRRSYSLTGAELFRISSELQDALFVIEEGPVTESIVRRELCAEIMDVKYGEAAAKMTMYQFASGRIIPSKLVDPATLSRKRNPEYALARKLAGNALPAGKVTEFDVTCATAVASGYTFAGNVPNSDFAERAVLFRKDDYPDLVVVLPRDVESSRLESGLWTVPRLRGFAESGNQFVVVSNGQHGPINSELAGHFIFKYGLGDTMRQTVTPGAEAGYNFAFGGRRHITAELSAVEYAVELAKYERLLLEHQAERNMYDTSTKSAENIDQ